MSSRLDDAIKSLMRDQPASAISELKECIYEAKANESIFIRHMGELTEHYLKLRASDEITTTEFKHLMEDLLDLNALKYRSLPSELMKRIETLAEKLSNCILDGLIPYLQKTTSGSSD